MSTQDAIQILSLESVRRKPGFLGTVWQFSRSKPMGAIGGVIIIGMILSAIFAGVISPYDPYRMYVSDLFAPPGTKYWFGTDNFGRDIFSRIVWGSRISLAVGVVSVAVGATGGAMLGLVSGFLGGKFDAISQRLVDIMMAFPVLILALTVVAALGPSIQNVIIAIALVMVPPGNRVVRSASLAVREMQYVDAARAIGSRNFRILFVHILPNCLAPYIIVATVNLGWAIVVEASLSFLGLGTPPPQPSWGAMLSAEGRSYLEKAPWIGIFPGVAISLAVFGFNILGDALRDVWDPRLRR